MGQDCSVQISNDLDIDIVVRLVGKKEGYLPTIPQFDFVEKGVAIGLEKKKFTVATDNILVEPGNKLKINALNKVQGQYTWVIAYRDGDQVREIQHSACHGSEKLKVAKSKGGTVHVKKGETSGTCDEQVSIDVLMSPDSVNGVCLGW